MSEQTRIPVWSMEVDSVCAHFKSAVTGISSEEARTRFIAYGPNRIQEKNTVQPYRIFLRQFYSPPRDGAICCGYIDRHTWGLA